MKIINVKGFMILVTILLAIHLSVGLLLSPILGSAIVEGINKAAGTKISVERISVWPLTMSCSLKDLKVFDPDDETQRMALVRSTSIRISPLKLLSKQIVFSSVTVSGARIDLRGEPDGSYNIQKLARPKETEKAAAERKSLFEQLKGREDIFGKIYEIIKSRFSKKAAEEKKEELKKAKVVKREIKPLPKGRLVDFTTASDDYIFQIRNFAVKDSTVNILTADAEGISIDNADIIIKNLGIDPRRGARFDKLHIGGKVDKDGASAGIFRLDYSQSMSVKRQSMVADLSAKDIDLSAVRFIYSDSLPVNFEKGIVSISSRTSIVDGELDSKNSLSLRGHTLVPGSGQKLTMGVVPLPALCEALNKVDPLDMKFKITGTVENPQFSGFQEVLMEIIKPYLTDVTKQLQEKGTKAITDLLRKGAGGEASDDDDASDAVDSLKSLFSK
jgi:uncharacterized protein involved in outer membrane biogenesis